MQSPGGQRIWKQLYRKRSINVYGWNFKTDSFVDISGSRFNEIYITNKQIEKAQPGKIQDLKGRASNIRLVACTV